VNNLVWVLGKLFERGLSYVPPGRVTSGAGLFIVKTIQNTQLSTTDMNKFQPDFYDIHREYERLRAGQRTEARRIALATANIAYLQSYDYDEIPHFPIVPETEEYLKAIKKSDDYKTKKRGKRQQQDNYEDEDRNDLKEVQKTQTRNSKQHKSTETNLLSYSKSFESTNVNEETRADRFWTLTPSENIQLQGYMNEIRTNLPRYLRNTYYSPVTRFIQISYEDSGRRACMLRETSSVLLKRRFNNTTTESDKKAISLFEHYQSNRSRYLL
jgi:hypothetical protein